MHIIFINSRDSKEIRTIYTKSDNIEIIMGSKTDDIVDELFESFLQNKPGRIRRIEAEVRGSKFVRDSVDLLYYHLQKTSLKRIGSSYIDSSKWLNG